MNAPRSCARRPPTNCERAEVLVEPDSRNPPLLGDHLRGVPWLNEVFVALQHLRSVRRHPVYADPGGTSSSPRHRRRRRRPAGRSRRPCAAGPAPAGWTTRPVHRRAGIDFPPAAATPRTGRCCWTGRPPGTQPPPRRRRSRGSARSGRRGRSTPPPRSAACTPDKPPLRLPTGVRTASTITLHAWLLLYSRHPPRSRSRPISLPDNPNSASTASVSHTGAGTGPIGCS